MSKLSILLAALFAGGLTTSALAQDNTMEGAAANGTAAPMAKTHHKVKHHATRHHKKHHRARHHKTRHHRMTTGGARVAPAAPVTAPAAPEAPPPATGMAPSSTAPGGSDLNSATGVQTGGATAPGLETGRGSMNPPTSGGGGGGGH